MKNLNIVTMDYRLNYRRQPIVYLFLREGNKRVVKLIKNFHPYFFATEKIPKEKQSIPLTFDKSNKKTLDGKNVFKVSYIAPSDTYTIRNSYKLAGKEVYEADIEYTRRWYIDNIEESQPINYRKFFIDIETSTDNGFPNFETPIEKITCITIYDSYTKQYVTLLLDEKDDLSEINTENNNTLLHFSNERTMLKYLIKIWSNLEPDIILGWNIEFDLFYILSRCKKLGVIYNSIGYNNEVRFELDKYTEKFKAKIRGSIIFDLLTAYRKILFHEISSYSLDYVTQKELGEKGGKEVILDFSKLWREEKEKLVRYNRKDVELIVKLDKKMSLVEYWDSVRVSCGVPDLNFARVAHKTADTLILRKFKEIAFPTKANVDNYAVGAEKKKEDTVGGGYLKVPEPDIYKWIAVFDFSSLYPNLIKTFNLSYDTYDEKNFDYITEEDSHKLKGFWNLKKKGIIPQLLDELISLRENYKQLRDKEQYNSDKWKVYDLFQYGIKSPLNAIYGVNLYPGFRLWKKEVGATITYLGRELDKFISKRIEEDFGIETIYADTDSLFLPLKKFDLKLAEEIKDKINNNYTIEFVELITNGKRKEHSLKIELEKIYDKVLLIKKRRYVGRLYWKDEKILVSEDLKERMEYKGVDLKRTNVPKIYRDGLEEFVNKLFKEEDYKTYLKEYLSFIEKNNDIMNFALPLKLSKVYKRFITMKKTKEIRKRGKLPQERAADYANEKFKLNLGVGSKFYGIWVKNLKSDIIGFDIPTRLENYERYIDKTKYKTVFLNKVQLLFPLDKNIIAELNRIIKGYSSLMDYF